MFQNLAKQIAKTPNKAGRIITGDCYETALEIVRTKLSWDTLEARREKQLQTLMIQIMKGNSTDYLRKFFTICTNQSYELRSNNNVLHSAVELNLPEGGSLDEREAVKS